MDQTTSVEDEVRGILDGGVAAPVQTREQANSADEAVELLNTRRSLIVAVQAKLDGLTTALGDAHTRASRTAGSAVESLEGPMAALRALKEVVDSSLAHVEDVCRSAGMDPGLTEATNHDDLTSTVYGDYGPAMGRIEPGDAVTFAKTAFRVIGKSGNSALIQPEKLARAVYGDFGPAMGRIASPGDFPGRGGKDFRDTSDVAPRATQPQGQSGHTALVGTTVLKYNPHTGGFSFPSGKAPGDYAMATAIQVVKHDPKLGRVVGSNARMSVEAFELGLDEAFGETTMERVLDVLESDQVKKVNGVMLDPATAALILQVNESLDEGNQDQLAELGVATMASISLNLTQEEVDFGLTEDTSAAKKLLAAALKKVESESIRKWVVDGKNHGIWIKIAEDVLKTKGGKADPMRFATYITSTAIGL